MAILPWSRDEWKAFRSSQYAIELCDHVIDTIESAHSWRSHSLSTFGAVHGVKLTIAPHITVLMESANAQFGWLALFLLNWTRTKSVHSLHRRELAPERLSPCAIDLRTPMHTLPPLIGVIPCHGAVGPVLGFTLGVTTGQHNLAMCDANRLWRAALERCGSTFSSRYHGHIPNVTGSQH